VESKFQSKFFYWQLMMLFCSQMIRSFLYLFCFLYLFFQFAKGQIYLDVFAGNTTSGYSGNGGLASSALVNEPHGIWGDTKGNIYVADNKNYRLRLIDASQIISTIAGTGTYGSSGASGNALSVSFGDPFGICGDTVGQYIYFSDQIYVWRYSLSSPHIVSFYVSSLMNTPRGLWMNTMGILYVASYGTNQILRISGLNIITLFAGTGAYADGGDGGRAISAGLTHPYGVHGDTIGNVFFTDFNNQKIRAVNASGYIRTVAGGSGDSGEMFKPPQPI
jgi:hypothetical protein